MTAACDSPLYIDEDSERSALVAALRREGLDVVAATELGGKGWPDDRHLANAAELGRVIYTCNQSDFVRLHVTTMRGGGHHAGIIVLSHQRLDIGAQLRGLIRLARDSALDEWRDRLEYVENYI